jgi:hypothetical protein
LLGPLTGEALASAFEGWAEVSVDPPAGVGFTALELSVNGETLSNQQTSGGLTIKGLGFNLSGTIEAVVYFYVDNNVTVFLKGSSGVEEGITYEINDAVLKFREGWNAVYTRAVTDVNRNILTQTGTASINVSLSGKTLKWIIGEDVGMDDIPDGFDLFGF